MKAIWDFILMRFPDDSLDAFAYIYLMGGALSILTLIGMLWVMR